jgi:ribonucleotide reductase beta subunit family protein with ferritin-like domain
MSAPPNYIEYICDPANEQPGFYPRKHTVLHKLNEEANAQYWPANEVHLDKDRNDFKGLTPDEQHVIMYVQMFFSQSDGLVQKNLGENFLNKIKIREALDFLITQNHAEMVHNQTYGNIIDHLFTDSPDLKEKILHAIQNFPEIKQISKWYEKWCDSGNFAEQLFAQVPSEGVLFQACFAILNWIRQYKGNILQGLTKANKLISIDETLHATFFAELYRMLRYRLTNERAHEIMEEAVEYATDFMNNAVKSPIIGLNANDMNTYIKFVADEWLIKTGHPKKWFVSNPFGWMVLAACETKGNMHEVVITAYNDKPDDSKGLAEEF